MAKRATTKTPLPTPVELDSRICFGIAYFATEADATVYAAYIQHRGDTYNGGWLHGMGCGRETAHDYTNAAGQRLFAVTTR